MKVKSVSILLILIALLFLPINVFAQQNLITVTPQLSRIDLSTDAPQTLIYYKNTTKATIELALSIQDVTELENRNPVGILDEKQAQNYKYSLSSWAYLETQSITLNPGEEGKVKVTINKEKLSPGGHYGAVLAEIKQKAGNEKVKLRGVLASLLFVRASSGNEIEEAKLAFFGIDQNFVQFPKRAIFRFQNAGNVDLIPYGTVEITDSNKKLVGKGIINEDSLVTLPEAIRQYTVPIIPMQNFILPGSYNVLLKLRYGKSNKTIEAKTTILTEGSIDTRASVAGIIALLVLFVIIRRKFKRKEKTQQSTAENKTEK